MELHIRPPLPADAERVVGISLLCSPDRPEDLGQWQTPPENTCLRVAVDAEGHLVGYGSLRPDPAYPQEPGCYRVALALDPAHQGCGSEPLLYDELSRRLQELGARWVRAIVSDSDSATIRLLENGGFEPYQRKVTLVQQLHDLAAVPELNLDGIEITTLASELEREPNCLLPIHEVMNACATDIPTGEPVIPPPFEVFQKMMEDPALLFDCFFLAKADGQYIGLSFAARSAQPHRLAHRFTGVLPSFRGLGLARAMKWKVARYALAHGYSEVVTSTQEANTAMLRVNTALGFRPVKTETRYRKALG